MTHENQPARVRPSLTTLIVVGLLAGIAWGVFFGEYGSWVKWIGDVYVGLLQMAILPFVVFSLIANVGRLSLTQGARLLKVSFLTLLLLWIIGLGMLAIMTQSFPNWETGSFFSNSFSEQTEPPDWLELFVPSNPFRSLSENLIPAVVVFSLGVGVALMSIPNKQRLLEPMDVIIEALSRLNKLVIGLTPLGLFGIVGYTAGTIDFRQFSLIQGYLLVFAVAALLVSLLILPILISSITPVKFRSVWRASRDPLIAAFVIGNTFVVLPMIIESVNKLLKENNLALDRNNEPDFLVPLAYPFPDVGKLVGLVFIPFAAWFYGTTIDVDQLPALLGVGLLGSFGKPIITIPLLLDVARLPNDIFNMFLASSVVAARFSDLMKCMHLITFTVLVSCFLNGTACIQWRLLLIRLSVSLLLVIMSVLGIRYYLENNFKESYSKENLVNERELVFPNYRPFNVVSPVVLKKSVPNPHPIKEGESRIDRIKRCGFIRVGYDPTKMPFSYFNTDGRLIGFDIEMAYYLADDLQVNIEFVPIEKDRILQQLEEDHFDVAMSEIEGTVGLAATLPAVEPYLMVNLAIVVPDYQKRLFDSVEDIIDRPQVRLAVIKGSFFAGCACRVLPKTVEIVEVESAKEYFDRVNTETDGLVISAESGSAWTLRKPNFSVTNPLRGRVKVPLYYVTAPDFKFEFFLQNWLTLKKSSGTFQNVYDYWILGRDVSKDQPRWCVIRNVLHWVR